MKYFKELVLGLSLATVMWYGGSAAMSADILSADDFDGPSLQDEIEEMQIVYLSAEEEESEEEKDFLCASNLYEKGDELVNDYSDFLDSFFQQDVPTSSQIESAMDYYRVLEQGIQNHYLEGFDVRNPKTFDLANAEHALCTQVRDQFLAYARNLLQVQALGATTSKRTLNIIDGLKIMNQDLEDLTPDFHKAFPAHFDEFKEALPCYARACIGS
jgi:hypothetical protein